MVRGSGSLNLPPVAKDEGTYIGFHIGLGICGKQGKGGGEPLKTKTNQILKADVRLFITLYPCFWTDD